MSDPKQRGEETDGNRSKQTKANKQRQTNKGKQTGETDRAVRQRNQVTHDVVRQYYYQTDYQKELEPLKGCFYTSWLTTKGHQKLLID